MTTEATTTEAKQMNPKMKLQINIDQEGKILVIGDMPTETGGRLHFEQGDGAAFIVKTTPTGEIEARAQGVSITDFFKREYNPTFHGLYKILCSSTSTATLLAIAESEKDIGFSPL